MRVSMKVLAAVAVIMTGVIGGATRVEAQQSGRGPEGPPVPLKVTVTIARYDGDKKTASLPFVLWVNTGDTGSIQMGSDVPVPATTFASKDGATTPTTSFSYRTLGTVITCSASALGDGLYRLSLNVNDTQVFRQPDAGALGPVFQNFKAQNSPLLRDGGSVQFAVATDKTSGEIIKLDVALSVVK